MKLGLSYLYPQNIQCFQFLICPFSKYLANFKDKDGMKYIKYNLEFFGLCKKCKVK